MKKLFSALLCISLVLAMMPATVFATGTTVNTEAELEEALEVGGEVVIGESFELTKTHAIAKNVTINLNGNTLSSKVDGAIFAFKTTADATFTGGTIDVPKGRGIGAYSGKLNLFNVKINSAGRGLGVYDSSTVYFDKDSVINAKAGQTDAAVIVWGDKDKKPTLTVAGEIYNDGETFAIAGNGADMSGTTISITKGAVVKTTSKKSPAIYHPQPGDIVIDGTVEGGNGIEIRAGNLSVNYNAKIISTADRYISEPNGNGSTAIGAAIAVNQHTTKLPINVGIYGGEIVGPAALVADGVQGQNVEDVNIDIKLGAFDGKVASVNNGGNILVHGGAFNDLDEETTTVLATDVVTITDGEETAKVMDLEFINIVLDELGKSGLDLSKFTLTIEKSADDSKFTVPVGIKVVNKSGDKVQVNDSTLDNGKEIQVQAPTKPEPKPEADKKPELKPEVKPNQESPKTADTMTIVPFAVLMIAAVGLIVAIKKKEN